jgi:hypothetical protein
LPRIAICSEADVASAAGIKAIGIHVSAPRTRRTPVSRRFYGDRLGQSAGTLQSQFHANNCSLLSTPLMYGRATLLVTLGLSPPIGMRHASSSP